MKKLLAACICTSLLLTLSGCSLGTFLEKINSTGDTSAREAPAENTSEEIKTRVYMDEIAGSLQDFNGSQLTVAADDNVYVFDVSQATLECADGMITGDEISVIYEGQLSDTDTSTVKALKVVDEFHKKTELKERKVQGQLLSLTANTITIKTKKGRTISYPVTGTEQYFQNGIKEGSLVYLHYKGKIPDDVSGSTVQNASHLKILSVSDIEPLKIPEPTPTPVPDSPETPQNPAEKEQQFLAVIKDVNFNILQILPAGQNTVLSLDMSAIPVYFKGGIAPGSHVNVTYKGELKENTLEGLTILAVTGEDPDTINNRHISFTASGTVLGTTANTVTIQTYDGAVDTFRTDDASDISTGGLEYGCGVCITFHPSLSKTSNIYTAVKIEDA